MFELSNQDYIQATFKLLHDGMFELHSEDYTVPVYPDHA